MLFAGIVDQNVQLAPFLDDGPNQSLAMFRIADVASGKEHFGAFLFACIPRDMGVVVFFEIGDGDLRPFSGEQHRGCSPYAAIATGYDGDLAFQSSRSGIARLPLGFAIEIGFRSRHPRFFRCFFDEGSIDGLGVGHG